MVGSVLLLLQRFDGRGLYRSESSAGNRPIPRVEARLALVKQPVGTPALALILKNVGTADLSVFETDFWKVNELLITYPNGVSVSLSPRGERHHLNWFAPASRDGNLRRWVAPGQSFVTILPDHWVSDFNLILACDFDLVCHHREVLVDALDIKTPSYRMHLDKSRIARFAAKR